MASIRPINDFERLRRLLEEMARLKEKQQIARDNGASVAQRAAIAADIGKVRAAIAAAAVAAVDREARAAQDEARRLAQGRPAKPQPNGGPGDPNPPGGGKPPDGGKGGDGGAGGAGGAGGGGGGGNDFSFGIQPGPEQKPGSQKIPGADLIYVRSEHTVWVWNRYTQTWSSHHFASTILSVEQISGGLLVVAEHEAVIFDLALAEWLPGLATPELLQAGPHGGGTSLGAVNSGPVASPSATPPSAPPQPAPAPSPAPVPSSTPVVSVPPNWQPNPAAPPNPELNAGLVIDPEPPADFPPPPPPN